MSRSNIYLAKKILEAQDKIVKGLRKYGAPSRNKGYIQVKVPTVTQQANNSRNLDT